MTMITRIWHGRTHIKDADIYLDYVRRTGLAEYATIKGNISAKLLRRLEGDVCHFLAISEWESIDCIKAFAGDDIERAKYYEEDKKYLLEFEEKVRHYETYRA